MASSADSLHWYEKTAVGLGMAAQSLVVTRWYLDGVAPASVVEVLVWVTVVVAVLAGLAFDAVVVVTTMGRREGRQSWWGIATAAAAAVFSAAVALHMYGGPSAGPWLHVGYPVITFLFVQHLAAPKTAALSEVEQLTAWLEQERTEAEQLKRTVHEQAQELEQAGAHAEQREAARLAAVSTAEHARAAAAEMNHQIKQIQRDLEQALSGGQLDRRALAQAMNAGGMRQREIATALNISPATVNNLLKPLNGKVLEEV